MREGWCSRASPPIFSTRLPLHSLVSLAGLPKYDLSSGLAREADKSPLRTKFGRANSTALATHTPRLASPNMPSPKTRQGRRSASSAETRWRIPPSAAPHASVLLGEGEGPSHTLMSLLTLGLLPCAAVAEESRFGRLFSTIDNAVNAGLASSSASTHRPSNFPCSRAFPVIHIPSFLLVCLRVTFASTALYCAVAETKNIVYRRHLQTCSTAANLRRSLDNTTLCAD